MTNTSLYTPRNQPGQKLHSELVLRRSLQPGTLERMYRLMSENYEKVDQQTFLTDLSRKQLVMLIRDTEAIIQGFTTFAVNPAGCGGDQYNIIFSGDTIISPDHWGTQEMMRGWCHTVGRLVAGQPDVDWYWYLMAKGHRTYLYLPLFFKEYYPSARSASSPVLASILDACSQKMFGSCWRPDKGLIIFPEQAGELKPELAQATYAKRHKADVGFFLERNPEFYKGHELACLASVALENFNSRCLPIIQEGMLSPLYVHEL